MSDNLEQVRFITANYSRLQGLRSVPIGIFIGLAGVWSSLPAGQGDLGIPLIMLVLAALAYIGVDRYYARTFGKVTITNRERNNEIIVAILFGIVALAGFIFDTSGILPISTWGLVFAAGLLVDFWQSAGKLGNNGRGPHPEAVAGAVLVAIASLLPLAGLQWWKLIGIQSSPAGLLILMGLLMILMGLFGHFRFIRSLKKLEEGIDA